MAFHITLTSVVNTGVDTDITVQYADDASGFNLSRLFHFSNSQALTIQAVLQEVQADALIYKQNIATVATLTANIGYTTTV